MRPKQFLQSHSTSTTTTKNHPNSLHASSGIYLNPKNYINVKQKRAMRIFTTTEPLDQSKIIQKYFGKKVLFVTRRSDISNAISFCKFFTKIRFSEKSPNQEPPFKGECTIEPGSFKSLGDRVILDHSVTVNGQGYKRLISHCDNLIIDICNYIPAITLKPIKYIANKIKCLKLTLPPYYWTSEYQRQEHRIMEHLQVLEDFLSTMTRLENFSLQLCEMRHYWYDYDRTNVRDIGPFLRILQKIIRLRSLRTFTLDTNRHKVLYKFLKALLLSLDKSQVQKWYVSAFMNFDDYTAKRMKSIGHVLETVDVLGLEVKPSDSDEYKNLPGPLIRNTQMTTGKKRVLDLEFTAEASKDVEDMLDLGLILRYCKSLEGIYLKSVWNMLNWRLDIPEMTNMEDQEDQEDQEGDEEVDKQGTIFLAKLTDVALIADDLNEDSIELNTFLAEVKKQNAPLRSLNLFYCYTEKKYIVIEKTDYFDHQYKKSNHRLSIPKKELKNMGTLEELTLHYSAGRFKINDHFKSLENLKKLTLCLGESHHLYCWDEDFSFESLTHLTEFRLIIHDDMKMLPWGKGLAEGLPHLSKLRVLEIIDNTDQTMELSALYNIMKGLAHFENLERLIIKTTLKRELTETMLLLVGEEVIRKGETRVFEDIKTMVRRLINANPRLEELRISEIEGYDISQIFYNGTAIKD